MATAAGRPIADFVVDRGLPHGVFLVCRHDERQSAALDYYKLGAGPFYTIVKNNIFVHLEILKTVRRMVETRSVLLDNSRTPELSLAGVAKRDLIAGDRIDSAIGSFQVRGHSIEIGVRPDHVPIGLLRDVVIHEPVGRGEIITFDHIELPDSLALDLWRDDILPRSLEPAPSGVSR